MTAEDGVLRQLLGDGAGTLLRTAGDGVDEQCLEDPPIVEGALVIEVAVLGGEGGVAHDGRDLRELHRAAADAAARDLRDQLSVAVEDAH